MFARYASDGFVLRTHRIFHAKLKLLIAVEPGNSGKTGSAPGKMGNCESSNTDLIKRNAEINRDIEKERRQDESVVKLLLLGVCILRIIHDHGYPPDEALQRKNMVHANAIQSIGAILNGMHELKIPLAGPRNQ
ncbi:unnamed protein product, partial [Anisakis simplex]|uniref:Uncharacterized protein n=1 Tax=Anisakis simplex TaxID=6269 RepID=A0A0M3JD71_ANISI